MNKRFYTEKGYVKDQQRKMKPVYCRTIKDAENLQKFLNEEIK